MKSINATVTSSNNSIIPFSFHNRQVRVIMDDHGNPCQGKGDSRKTRHRASLQGCFFGESNPIDL